MPRTPAIEMRGTKRFRVNVRAHCTEHGSVTELAQKSRVDRVYLSRLINRIQGPNGRACVPTLDVALRIAAALKVDLEELLR